MSNISNISIIYQQYIDNMSSNICKVTVLKGFSGLFFLNNSSTRAFFLQGLARGLKKFSSSQSIPRLHKLGQSDDLVLLYLCIFSTVYKHLTGYNMSVIIIHGGNGAYQISHAIR